MEDPFKLLEIEISKMQKEQSQSIVGRMSVIFLMISPVITMTIGAFYSAYLTNDDQFKLLTASLCVGGGIVFLLGNYGYIIDVYLVKKVSDTLKKYNELLSKELPNIESIYSVLSKTKRIYRTLYAFTLYMKIAYFFEGVSNSSYKLVVTYENSIMFKILTDLRSDLQIRLTEQQKLLESARSETNSNLKGTSELVNISELQQARLDRQIEQFEELQKVLGKV